MTAFAIGDHRRRDDHRGAELDEERDRDTRSRNEADAQRRELALRGSWHFGMKLHVGTDMRGIVHAVTATAASAADISQLPDLLHGQEKEIFGDQAYWKEADREAFTAGGVRSASIVRLAPKTIRSPTGSGTSTASGLAIALAASTPSG